MRPYPLKNLSTSFSLADGLKRPMKIRQPLIVGVVGNGYLQTDVDVTYIIFTDLTNTEDDKLRQLNDTNAAIYVYVRFCSKLTLIARQLWGLATKFNYAMFRANLS